MIKHEIRSLLKSILSEYDVDVDFVVEVPPSHFGDFSSNVAMVSAKHLKKPPIEIAKNIVGKLKDHPMFEEISIAGPGFINFKVSKTYYVDFLESFLHKGMEVWNLKKKNYKIIFEYGSANPTGPFTVGHGRQIIIGDVLASVFKFYGYDVFKEVYINDAGRQIKLLAKSVWARYNQLLEEDEPIPEDGYRGDYIIDIAKKVLEKEGERFKKVWNDSVEEVFKKYALETMLSSFNQTFERLGSNFDNFYSEKSLIEDGTVEEVLRILKENDLTYESEGALWFKVSKFEKDSDKVLIKSDGNYTYFLTDIAYHYRKFKRGFNKAIDIMGSDHHGHIPRMYAGIKALGIPEDFLVFLLHQFVTLKRGDEIVKMSTRAGEFVTLDELIDEVGKDATRYFFSMVDVNTHLNFDLELAKSASNDNPVYYVKYAHARICSLFENAKEKSVEFKLGENIELLTKDEESQIIKEISTFDDAIERIIERLSPHYLTDYLENLASKFHKYYAENKIVDPNNIELSNARLNLAYAVREVLRIGLELLGIEAPERM